MGKDASAELELEYSNEKQVTKDTPRAFIVYSDDDKVVPPANGVNYYLALNKNNVPSVLHIYPSGGHGWGIREGFLYKNEMLDELTSWLRSFKVPHKDAIRVACIGNSITYGARIKNRDRDSYPAVLSRMLGEAYWVKNFGVSARTLLNKGDHPYMNEKLIRMRWLSILISLLSSWVRMTVNHSTGNIRPTSRKICKQWSMLSKRCQLNRRFIFVILLKPIRPVIISTMISSLNKSFR